MSANDAHIRDIQGRGQKELTPCDMCATYENLHNLVVTIRFIGIHSK